METNNFINLKNRIVENVSKVIIGKNDIIELITISFICGGHILLEDVPGVGKTVMVKAFSKTIGGDFKRVQFTPDLLPSDLTGINFYNQKTTDFEFRQGPLITNIDLAEEINRATPRTQSSLLEAMEEKQVTVDGTTRKLEEPFMVLATQNPVESYGTFPLPEAQMDRFFMRINMGYPTRNEEIDIVCMDRGKSVLDGLQCVIGREELKEARNSFNEVKASQEVMAYIMDIIEATRKNERIILGASPRGTMALYKACQVNAAMEGREFIIPEDVKKLAPYVLNHRIITKGVNKGQDIYEFIRNIVNSVKTPVEDI